MGQSRIRWLLLKRYRKRFLLYWLLSRNILLLLGLHCRSIVHGLRVLAVQYEVQSTGSKSSLYSTRCSPRVQSPRCTVRGAVHGFKVLAVQYGVQSTGSKSSLYGTGCKLPPARVLLLQHWNRPWVAGPRCAVYMYTYSPRSGDPGCTVHDIVQTHVRSSLYSIGNTPWVQVPRCTVQDRLNCLKILAVQYKQKSKRGPQCRVQSRAS